MSCICLLADVTLVTGHPYARNKAVLAKQKFVNMDQSILKKFTYTAARVTIVPLPKYGHSDTYQDAYMADYCPQVN